MKRIAITIIFWGVLGGFILPASSAALTLGDFLATAWEDPAVAHAREAESILKNRRPETPYLDSVEFRTETDRFELSNQKFSLRFYLKSRDENRLGASLIGTRSDLFSTRKETSLHQALKERYLLLIEKDHCRKMLKIEKKWGTLYEDRVRVVKELAQGLHVGIDVRMKAEQENLKGKLAVMARKNRLEEIRKRIGFLMPQADGISLEKIVGVNTIKARTAK